MWTLYTRAKGQVYALSKEKSVFANMKQLINVKANLFVTSNQLGWNANCYDEAGCNGCNDEAGISSCYNKAGRNSCYDEAGRIGILLRILQLVPAKDDLHVKKYMIR